VLCIVLVDVFDAEVINNQGEMYFLGFMLPYAVDEFSGGIAVRLEELDKLVIG
jgi:hypothetical protein